MKNIGFLQIFASKWRFILGITAIVIVATFVLTIVQTPLYRTSVEILVIPQNVGSVDAFTAAKSSEQLARTYGEIITTNSFMDKALGATASVKDTFSNSAWERKNEWNELVETKVVTDTGFLKIDVYGEDKQKSAALATAITSDLTSSGADYLGASDAVTIKLIDGPITYDKVAKPNIAQNLVLGVILGLLGGIGLTFTFSDRSSRSVFGKTEDFEPETVPSEHVFMENNPLEDMEGAEASVGLPEIDDEPVLSEVPQDTTAEAGVAPANLPVSPGGAPAGLPVVESTQKEESEISPEEQANNWLATGKIDK